MKGRCHRGVVWCSCAVGTTHWAVLVLPTCQSSCRDCGRRCRYFKKKLGYIPEADPAAPQLPRFEEAAGLEGPAGLDVALAASGFKTKHQRALEQYAAVTPVLFPQLCVHLDWKEQTKVAHHGGKEGEEKGSGLVEEVWGGGEGMAASEHA